jgi:hypothetical protein
MCREVTANEADSLLPLNQIVRLMKNIPESSLRCGELGIVISIWCAPIVAYEVEFLRLNEDFRTRVLVFGRHLQAEPEPTRCDQTTGSKGRVNAALHMRKEATGFADKDYRHLHSRATPWPLRRQVTHDGY